jgi:glycosyltransferase involved in cell wall biosynthesis
MTTPSQELMEVTMIWNYPNWGGAQIYFLSIVRNAPSGWKMRLVLPSGSSSEVVNFFEAYGVSIEYLTKVYEPQPAPSLIEKLKRQWQRIRSEVEVYGYSRRNLKENSIVHIEAPPWQSWVLLYFLSRHFHTVATVHNSIPAKDSTWRGFIWQWRMNFLLGRKNFQLFAANQDAVNSIRSYVRQEYWEKISLTRAAIDPAEIDKVRNAPFDRNAALQKCGLSADRFIVLCVGQFIDRKGRWVFLDAARQACAAGNDLFFVWLGPKPLTAADESRISEYGVGDYFKFILSETLGPSRSDVLTFFRIADVFVLASYLEGLPISIIEALALGLPVISTNINGIPEAVVDQKTGLLIEPGDHHALNRAILKLRSNPEFRNCIATAGRAFTIETFDERAATAVAFDRYLYGFERPRK